MWDVCKLIGLLLIGLFRSRAALEAEILVLRQQIVVLRRTAPKRLRFNALDRLIFVGLSQMFPNVRQTLAIVKPQTIVRWHRAGFRAYWRWRSRSRPGRPKVALEIRRLIRDMSLANPLWGAPRIHGELLKLGIDIGQTTVAKYMAKRRRPPSQGWKIGSIRRECVDHVIIFGERHLRHVLQSYLRYYNETRTHLSLDKDTPISRSIETVGRILGQPILGGLHHQYVRI